MASGGMEWAYRMVALHKLDPLGLAVVLHLGWRDAANFRTDNGIARALGQHRSAVRKATARLAALGLIVRRSGQWVACETVAIVEQRLDAPRPDLEHCDKPARPLSGHGHSVATPRPLSGHSNGHSVATKRIENIETCAHQSRNAPRRALPPQEAARRAASSKVVQPVGCSDLPDLAQAVGGLSAWEQNRLRSGGDLLLPGLGLVKPGTAVSEALLSALRASEAGL